MGRVIDTELFNGSGNLGWHQSLPTTPVKRPTPKGKPNNNPAATHKPQQVALELPKPPQEKVPTNSRLKWYAGYMLEGLFRLAEGDQVYVREFYAPLHVGKCWWVMSSRRKLLYLVAETYGGSQMERLVRFVCDPQHRKMVAPTDQVELLNTYFTDIRGAQPTSRMPVTNALNK